MVEDFLKDIKIGEGDSIFELGCGTGAPLKRLRLIHGPNLKIGGSDISTNAIEVAKKSISKRQQSILYHINDREKYFCAR